MNHFHIYEAIGHGKYSTVYKGRKKKSIEYFAIKSVDKSHKSKILQEHADKQKSIAGLVPAIEKARLYRGKGGEIMRSAVSRFIECVSLSNISLPEKIKHSLLDTLNENMRHPNSQIQNVAVEAFKHFVLAYLVEEKPEDRDAEARVNAVKGLVSACETLCATKECSQLLPEEDIVSLYHMIMNEVMHSLLEALEDYSVDNRGDVGS
ncbi:hypothetical protein POM88_043464 [Heracleum sosnowskyi]|uniref:Protein kinase domain-containing protein n=1 Tax=Heracleum sosnowskyi TaxID=360622 RepID=A0AAD8H3J2_9APIA|nr:hypothetical protein POM88_043464 [Heracleum sosnowskyi]